MQARIHKIIRWRELLITTAPLGSALRFAPPHPRIEFYDESEGCRLVAKYLRQFGLPIYTIVFMKENDNVCEKET